MDDAPVGGVANLGLSVTDKRASAFADVEARLLTPLNLSAFASADAWYEWHTKQRGVQGLAGLRLRW